MSYKQNQSPFFSGGSVYLKLDQTKQGLSPNYKSSLKKMQNNMCRTSKMCKHTLGAIPTH